MGWRRKKLGSQEENCSSKYVYVYGSTLRLLKDFCSVVYFVIFNSVQECVNTFLAYLYFYSALYTKLSQTHGNVAICFGPFN
jgi:hypothetical protein